MSFRACIASFLVGVSTLSSASGFRPLPGGGVRTCTGLGASRQGADNSVDRRDFAKQAVGLGLALGVLSVRTEGASAALTTTYAPYATFEESIGAVLLSKKVMEPVRRYIEIGQYDPARSNIKYVTNQLRIKKAMEKAVDLAITESEVDPDVLEAGAEGSAMIDNLLSQLDSSVYTNIFVPTEGDEFGPTAEKYRQQAFGFYEEVMSSIDHVLALASDKDKAKAEQLIAKQPKLPSFLFKDFSNEFYRPATP